MRDKTFKYIAKFFFFLCLIYSTTTIAQTEFFHSKISFSESNLEKFYSSFSVDSSQVYINANDYYVHAYDKQTNRDFKLVLLSC